MEFILCLYLLACLFMCLCLYTCVCGVSSCDAGSMLVRANRHNLVYVCTYIYIYIYASTYSGAFICRFKEIAEVRINFLHKVADFNTN
jgi:hypothetical protein